MAFFSSEGSKALNYKVSYEVPPNCIAFCMTCIGLVLYAYKSVLQEDATQGDPLKLLNKVGKLNDVPVFIKLLYK